MSKIDNYTAAVNAIENHKEDNKSVFDAHQTLLFRLIDAENELRDDAAARHASDEAYTGETNGSHRITVTPQTQTFVDIEKLDAMVASGRISKEIRDELVQTNTRPPRITIGTV